MTTTPATQRPGSRPSTRSGDSILCNTHHAGKLYNDLRLALGMPMDPSRPDIPDETRARELLPGWSVEIREAEVPRLKGWWQCALARAANHGGRPLLIYRIGWTHWSVIMAVRDLAPLYAHLPQQLVVQTGLVGLAAVIQAQPDQTAGADPTPRRARSRRTADRITASQQHAGIAQG